MRGTGIDFGGVMADSHTFRVKVSDGGAVVLDVMSRYGSSNNVNYSMTAEAAALLAERLDRAVRNAETIAAMYLHLNAEEAAFIKEVMEPYR